MSTSDVARLILSGVELPLDSETIEWDNALHVMKNIKSANEACRLKTLISLRSTLAICPGSGEVNLLKAVG